MWGVLDGEGEAGVWGVLDGEGEAGVWGVLDGEGEAGVWGVLAVARDERAWCEGRAPVMWAAPAWLHVVRAITCFCLFVVTQAGVYVNTHGPRFETKAEIRHLATVVRAGTLVCVCVGGGGRCEVCIQL